MNTLPIVELREKLVESLGRERRVILQAPTGSGKSTQVPQFLLDAGLLGTGEAVILQPRRLPTRMLAARVAQERGTQLGKEVGYQIRFEAVCGRETRLRFVTEGLLLRQMLSDPELRGVSFLIFDEFHERHLHGDITLARALEIQRQSRPDLGIIVMSATLETEALARYLDPCVVLTSQGRTFPVEIEYLDKPVDTTRFPIWELAAEECARVVRQHREGDVLIFMPGSYEIQRTLGALRATLSDHDFAFLPLHGELPPAEQDLAVLPHPTKRKIIVSTNVAETSLTIDGVRVVIDSGVARIARHDPHRGINTLLVEKISRASADQRAGRAGRTAAGRCLRLWTEREHRDRAAQELPEIKRLELAESVLTLKACGVADVSRFAWLEAPDAKGLDRAETLLRTLGACDAESGQLTPLGRRMVQFPLHPRYARMMLAADELGCVRQVALIAALTQGRPILVPAPDRKMLELREEVLGSTGESDFFLLMRAWRYAEKQGFDANRCRPLGVHAQAARQVLPLVQNFLRIAEGQGLTIDGTGTVSDEAIQRCVLLGFPDHLAKRLDGGTLRCALVHKRRGTLVKETVVQHAPLLVAGEVREVQQGRERELNTLLSLNTAVQQDWLREYFPHQFRVTQEVVYDATLKRVVGYRRTQFLDLVLEEALDEQPPAGEAAAVLAAEVTRGNLVLHGLDDAAEQWVVRLNRLAEWMPELELPRFDEESRRALLEQMCLGARFYREIKDRPVLPVFKTWLSPQQQQWVEEYAPERLQLPGGRRAKVTYHVDRPPVLAARIQDLYEVKQELKIAGGRVSLVIEILAPNQRPVQVTTNLANFWKESYPALKIELARRYPRHEWR